MSENQGRGSGSSTPVKQAGIASSQQAAGSNTSTSGSVTLSQPHLIQHAVGLSPLSISASHLQALHQQHGSLMSQATQRGQQQSQSVQPQVMHTNHPSNSGNMPQPSDQHQQQQLPQGNNHHEQHQQQTQNPQANMQPPNPQNSALSNPQQQPNQPPSSSVVLSQSQQNTGGQNTSAVSIQQQHALLAHQQQQNVAGVLHHAQQQNSLHANSQSSINTSNTISAQQTALMGNNQNHQQSQQQQQASGQPQSMGPPHPQQHQNPAIMNQGNMVRVSVPIQNLPQGMQGVQAIQSIAGMQGMQPIPQLQQLQNVQQIQGMQQMQGLQQIPAIQQVQGVQQMQQLQGVPGLQGVQVLGPMQNFQGSQFLAGQPYLPPVFQNQLQAQMMSPALNLQNMQGAPKSPGIPTIQQQQQVEVYTTTFQPLQIQQQQNAQQQQQQQQQQAIVNAQNPSSGSGTPTKTSIPVTRPTVGGPQQQQPGVVNIQQGQQAQIQQPQQPLMGQMKPVVQQQPRPVVIGQLAGVISNQGTGNQTVINQPKSPLIAPGNQMISNQQLRFSSQPTIVNSNGQIVQPVMSMNQFQAAGNIQQNMSLAQAQPIFATQGGTILSTQPVYIRAAAPLQQQQGICVQVTPGIKPKDVKTGVANIPQGARTITPVQMGVKVRPPAPRTIRPQKTTSPRNIQPKPPNSNNIGVSSLPTAMVSPKPGTSKPAQTVTKVVTCTATPRVAPTESQPSNSIVSTINKGANMLTKVLSNHSVADISTPEPILIDERSTAQPAEENKENVKKEEVTATSNSSCIVSSSCSPTITTLTTTVTTTTITKGPATSITSPLSILEPKAPPGTDFVVSRTAEKKQAIVKPVLTHVIEGFVIQEATEPFPVHRSNMMGNLIENKQQEVDMEVDKMTTEIEPQKVNENDGLPCCELCKKQMPSYKLKASKRFCSNVCAKRYNVGCTKRVGLFRGNNMYDKYSNRKRQSSKEKDGWSRTEDGGRITTGPIKRVDSQQPLTLSLSTGTSSQSDDDSNQVAAGLETSSEAEETESQAASTTTDGGSSVIVQEEEEMASPARSPPELERVDEMDVSVSMSSSNATEATISPQRQKPLQQWNVQEVSNFINSLPGCGMYADMFSSQEIDGQALMLLKEDHLMTAMNIKLGPALKICASIKQILEES